GVEEDSGTTPVGLGHHEGQVRSQQGLSHPVEHDALHAGELVQDLNESREVQVGFGLALEERARAGLAELVAAVGRLDVDLPRGSVSQANVAPSLLPLLQNTASSP